MKVRKRGFCNIKTIMQDAADVIEELLQDKEQDIDWSKAPADTPILVRDSDRHEWEKRHFAFYNKTVGMVAVFVDGKTSFTISNSDTVKYWLYAKLYEKE